MKLKFITQLSHDLCAHLGLSLIEYCVAFAIYNLQKKTGWCTAKKSSIAKGLYSSEKSVLRAIKTLESKGLLLKQNKGLKVKMGEKWLVALHKYLPNCLHFNAAKQRKNGVLNGQFVPPSTDNLSLANGQFVPPPTDNLSLSNGQFVPPINKDESKKESKKKNLKKESPTTTLAGVVGVENFKKILLEDSNVKELSEKVYALEKNEFEKNVTRFILEAKATGKMNHEKYTNFRSHFCHWLKIQEQNNQLKNGREKNNIPHAASGGKKVKVDRIEEWTKAGYYDGSGNDTWD